MELERAAQDATMRTKQVEIEMDQFEKRKLADMKVAIMILYGFMSLSNVYCFLEVFQVATPVYCCSIA